jgi:subtilisin family serine protease
MWDIENSGASDTIIAVIDNGVEYTNQDLDANMWNGSAGCKSDTNSTIPGGCPYHGWDYKNNDSNPETDLETVSAFYHGTLVSSIIASETNNARGIAGVSRYGHNKIMALKFDLYVDSEIKAINFAKNNGAKVINASFVGTGESIAEKEAIDSFPGIFVAASGNAGKDVGVTPYYPCSYTSSNIICVGSSDQDDSLSSFSNYNAAGVDIAAPGDNIAGLVRGSVYAYAYGTSFSAPYVAGVAGVLYSQNPSASISTVRNTLLRSSDHKASLSGKIACGRRLNANAALANMQSSTIPTENCSNPVYRFWSSAYRHHFFTMSDGEKNKVNNNYDDSIWKYEGIGY